MEQTGLDAMPIVGLLSFLIGIVMAYQGADQLRRFGAEIYTVNLLGISILRELGVLLAAIIIAGRSGSAFTAQIGTMQVNQEIDAMRTLGLDPVEVLVLPRVFGLMLTLPLLVFYADAMGLIGGCLMTWATLGITRAGVSRSAARRDHRAGRLWVGVIKAPFFAAIIAMVGCYEGFNVSRQRRERRPADDPVGGRVDLPGHRRRCRLLGPLLDAADLSVADTSASDIVIRVRGLVTRFGAADRA